MGRKALALILVALLALAEPALVFSQGTCSTWRTYTSGDSFTASEANSLQVLLGQTNMEFACLDGLGDTNAQFDDTLAPTTSTGARVLSTQGYHDIANLRYVALHVFGATNWWSVPYENVNFRHRQVRQHFGTLFHAQQMFRGEAHLSSATTRFHLVAFGTDREMAAGSAHPESAWLLIHVNTSVRFMVGIGGDVHVGNTLMVHAAGTATHAAIFRAASPATGISWPLANHLSISSINIAGGATGAESPAEVARFHLGGIFLARSHVNGTTPPRNTLSASNLVKAWARGDGNGQLLDGYGVTSVTRSSSGVYVITWQNPFANANYAISCTAMVNATTTVCQATTITASSVTISVHIANTGSNTDRAWGVIAIGTQ